MTEKTNQPQEQPHPYGGQQVVSLKAGQKISAHIQDPRDLSHWRQHFTSEEKLYRYLQETGDTLLSWEWEDYYEFVPYDQYLKWVEMGRETPRKPKR